jgi:hypothetical protein
MLLQANELEIFSDFQPVSSTGRRIFMPVFLAFLEALD